MNAGGSGSRRAASPARIALALLLGALAATPVGAGTGDPSNAGAYCPLPKPGEKPSCLAPAQARYSDFFAAVEEGDVDPADAAAVEADLKASAASPQAYLALSSLSYGYWRLALRAAQTEQVDPEVRRQLEHWNALLASAYQASSQDPEFRSAVRAAATDLHERTPESGFECLDAEGNPARCRPSDGLLASLDSLDQELGMRGAIRRVLRRIFGGEGG